MKSLVVMQPYIFPYIGYFQLVHSSDSFIFYDDVNFIKRGWINRNNILLNCAPHRFTVPLKKASQNKLINEIETRVDQDWIDQLDKTLRHAYSLAPNFSAVRDLIISTVSSRQDDIGALAALSITNVCDYLKIDREFDFSSEIEHDRSLSGSSRIIDICKKLDADQYINARNGLHLYDESEFQERNIELRFIDPIIKPYEQGGCKEFVPFQSIIDVLMWNGVEEVRSMVAQYKLKRKIELE